ETDELFMESYNFINALDISYLHVFTYSERDNTLAAEMPGTVDYAVRKKRSKMLRVLSAKKRRAFYESQLGKEKEILLEGNFKEGYMTGFTENYVKVKTLWDPELINTKHRVRLEKIDKDGSVLFKTLTQEPILA
ncbi:MAG TPA: tRNA (N(6)-L-threonylcarbamoyladenosine(37)-C(2))-methylthiotransferase MtaB, partial [Cryomorphaceae bacterium]|nr:tRNA (N(6)-L-threonylcarbamoyladenosine(37)-C(2))-methylthiotransferase MtaB [Cryomorphaceae bacterium]